MFPTKSPAPTSPSSALVIAMPTGLPLSGITTWAVRLANALTQRADIRVALLVHDHAEVEGQPSGLELGPAIELVPVSGGPPIHTCRGDYRAFLPKYRQTIERLADETGRPIVAIPTLSGDCHGIFACLAQANPESLRIVSWTHNDIAYDYRTAAHYEPVISAFAGISRRITSELARHLPARAGEIHYVPSLIPCATRTPQREPLTGRPLRLIYTGRIEHEQKRIGALIEMSNHLAGLGVSHELSLVGDGPARAEIARRIESTQGRVRLIFDEATGAPLGLRAMAPLLARSDMFVLASRYEGACISMLEAMGQGAVPIVPADVHASLEAIEPGEAGEAAGATRHDSERDAGIALADAVRRVAASDIARRAERCRALVERTHGADVHLDAALRVLDSARRSAQRWWPADRPCAPAAAQETLEIAGSMTVPPDAAQRARAALDRLAGRRTAIWGAGRHTIALATALAESAAHIVAIVDDDPRRCAGHLWGFPVIAPADIASTGATDILISSWMHESAMWARRAAFESRGVRVHRLYGDQTAADAA